MIENEHKLEFTVSKPKINKANGFCFPNTKRENLPTNPYNVSILKTKR